MEVAAAAVVLAWWSFDALICSSCTNKLAQGT